MNTDWLDIATAVAWRRAGEAARQRMRSDLARARGVPIEHLHVIERRRGELAVVVERPHLQLELFDSRR